LKYMLFHCVSPIPHIKVMALQSCMLKKREMVSLLSRVSDFIENSEFYLGARFSSLDEGIDILTQKLKEFHINYAGYINNGEKIYNTLQEITKYVEQPQVKTKFGFLDSSMQFCFKAAGEEIQVCVKNQPSGTILTFEDREEFTNFLNILFPQALRPPAYESGGGSGGGSSGGGSGGGSSGGGSGGGSSGGNRSE
jgi:uncharacterized membrane protein YgcG